MVQSELFTFKDNKCKYGKNKNRYNFLDYFQFNK